MRYWIDNEEFDKAIDEMAQLLMDGMSKVNKNLLYMKINIKDLQTTLPIRKISNKNNICKRSL